MGDIVAEPLDDYLEALLPARPPVMAEMEAHAADRGFPIVGPQVGRLFAQYAALLQPARIFEMGSGFGYSALWFLTGCPTARVVCTDLSSENIDRGKHWLSAAGLGRQVTWCEGRAEDVLREQTEAFDLIFIDSGKEGYPEAFDLAAPRLRRGGLLLADNALRHGRVADPGDASPGVEAVRRFTRMVYDHPDFLAGIVPLRDGVLTAVKCGDPS